MKFRSFLLVLLAVAAFAAKPTQDIAVTSYLSDISPAGVAYYIQSDAQVGPGHGQTGEYDNGSQGVASILTANTYNSLPPGDWQLNTESSTVRTMQLTLSSLNEIQPGQPGYTVPPNPPFTGTQNVASKFEDKCTAINLDSGTMQAGQVIQCPAEFSFLYNNARGTHYGLGMNGTVFGGDPESTEVQIQCNSIGSNGYCNDWFVDPIPMVNADGSTSPGQAIARLSYVARTSTNLGGFYVTFHVHLTRP